MAEITIEIMNLLKNKLKGFGVVDIMILPSLSGINIKFDDEKKANQFAQTIYKKLEIGLENRPIEDGAKKSYGDFYMGYYVTINETKYIDKLIAEAEMLTKVVNDAQMDITTERSAGLSETSVNTTKSKIGISTDQDQPKPNNLYERANELLNYQDVSNFLIQKENKTNFIDDIINKIGKFFEKIISYFTPPLEQDKKNIENVNSASALAKDNLQAIDTRLAEQAVVLGANITITKEPSPDTKANKLENQNIQINQSDKSL